MNITHVKVALGTTLNLGNFNSLRLDVELTAEIEPGDEWLLVVQQLHTDAKEEVKRQARSRRHEEDAA